MPEPVEIDDTFRVQVTILGPEKERETPHGLRADRERLASLDVPATPARAWEIYTLAVQRSIAGEPRTIFPVTDETGLQRP